MAKTFALDGFEPIKRIGGGGFGDVWLARQTNVDREVAVKVGHAPIQDDIIRLRFDRECKALGRLSGHPNIVDVFTAGSLDDGRPYLVLEYIDGGTLWQRLKQSPVTDDELIRIGYQLADALARAHSSGVLHRDLKPENILMRSSGDAVLGDFGIARLQDGMNTTSAAITASVAYAAPEVLGGTQATAASDLYGVGVCLLAAVMRSVPFVDKGDKSIHPIISRVMSEEPPDLRSRGVSEDLAKLIESLLQKNPNLRPVSAADVQEMFQSLTVRPWQSDQHLLAARRNRFDPAPSPRPHPTGLGAGSEQATPSADAGSPISSTGTGRPSALTPGQSEATAGSNRFGDATGVPLTTRSGSPDRSPFGVPNAERARRAITGDDTSSNVKAFALAYVATLVAGAIVIFILAQLLS
ncbi:MAG: serine/threonine protein kinase [Acidimicrobiia bacterium]|nr:serine/threonine protein kinase [Acidimicrobiia bacterium]MDH5518931.1 serine/threonine protein kinase [Acidimicrobiia bacterium]